MEPIQSDVYWPAATDTPVRSGASVQRPVFLWGTKRGAIMGYGVDASAPQVAAYVFDHLANDVAPDIVGDGIDPAGNPPDLSNGGASLPYVWSDHSTAQWTSTGLECSVALGSVVYRTDTHEFYGATGDSSLFVSPDEGEVWQHEAERWTWGFAAEGETFVTDRGEAMVYDDTHCRLYVATCTNASQHLSGQYNECTVMMNDATAAPPLGGCISHTQAEWVPIGGSGYGLVNGATHCDHEDNGLPYWCQNQELDSGGNLMPRIRRITALSAERTAAGRVLAGTIAKGLWVYDPAVDPALAPQWTQVSGTTACSIAADVRINEIRPLDDTAGADLLVTVGATGTNGGVYRVRWDAVTADIECVALVDQSTAPAVIESTVAVFPGCTASGHANLREADAIWPVTDSNGDVIRLLASRTRANCPPRIFALEATTTGGGGITPIWGALPTSNGWNEQLDLYDLRSDSDDAFGQRQRDITSIVQIPDTDVVLAATHGLSRFDFEVASDLYVSQDGGLDWARGSDVGLPRLAMRNVTGMEVIDDMLIVSTAGAGWWYLDVDFVDGLTTAGP